MHGYCREGFVRRARSQMHVAQLRNNADVLEMPAIAAANYGKYTSVTLAMDGASIDAVQCNVLTH